MSANAMDHGSPGHEPPVGSTRPVVGWPWVLMLAAAALVGAFYGVENWRGARAWAAEQARLKARGEPLTWAEWIVRPPAASNMAEATPFKGLLDYTETRGPDGKPRHTWAGKTVADRWHAMLDIAPAKDSSPPDLSGSTFPVMDLASVADQYRRSTNFPGVPRTADPARDILAALETRREFLAEIEEATRRPTSAFAIRYEDHALALLPHLALIKSAAHAFRHRAAALLAAGDRSGALRDIGTIHRLARAAGSDPTLIGMLVHGAVETLAMDAAWQGWRVGAWGEPECKALQEMFSEADLRPVAVRAFRSERLFGSSLIEFLARNPDRYFEILGNPVPGDDTSLAGRAISLMPIGWLRQNQARHARHLDAIVEMLQRAPRGLALMPDAAPRLPVEDVSGPVVYRMVCRELIPALSTAASKIDRVEVLLLLARVAFALERHRLATGRWPANLADLVPGQLASIPIDPMDGQPLRYKPGTNGTCLLYSVGPDGRDDGGSGTMHAKPPADWTWRASKVARETRAQ